MFNLTRAERNWLPSAVSCENKHEPSRCKLSTSAVSHVFREESRLYKTAWCECSFLKLQQPDKGNADCIAPYNLSKFLEWLKDDKGEVNHCILIVTSTRGKGSQYKKLEAILFFILILYELKKVFIVRPRFLYGSRKVQLGASPGLPLGIPNVISFGIFKADGKSRVRQKAQRIWDRITSVKFSVFSAHSFKCKIDVTYILWNYYIIKTVQYVVCRYWIEMYLKHGPWMVLEEH